MRERQKIVELWRRGDAAVLVTVVRVEGSSYRKPGARLLIAANGEYAGSVSGGCLEAEVIRKAQWKVRSGAVVDRYSTFFDDTAEMSYGLGCGGTVDLLLEPAGTPEFTALMEAMGASLHGELRRVATQLPEVGCEFSRSVLNEHGKLLFRSLDPVVGRDQPLFEEVLEPVQRLIVFGAGNDAQPMVQCAAMLGWRIVVVDARSQWIRADRFPEAERLLFDLERLTVEERDAVLLMTHSYEQDRAGLIEALPARPRYLGLLGARHRAALLLSEAAATLGWELETICASVFAPMGLDLGGDGAEAIAFATIAEILACCEGKHVVRKRMTAEVVRQQIVHDGSSRFLKTQCAL